MGDYTTRLNLYKPDSDEKNVAKPVNDNWDAVDALKLDELNDPDDNTDLNASTSRHGLCPKLPNDEDQFLDGTGAWATPTGTGNVLAPASNTDGKVPQWDGDNSRTLKDGLTIGTGANNLVQLDGSSKLPAVDGSQLTNISGQVIFRGGDSASNDWDATSLTTDGSWHDLDCSAIVPSGAVAIIIRCAVQDGGSNNKMAIKKKGNTYTTVGSQCWIPATNGKVGNHFTVECDSDRKLQYWFTNTTWTFIRLHIIGWILG